MEVNKNLNLDNFWIPFTNNTAFKKSPRLLVKAHGMYYISDDGRRILDAISGMWCCNAGHCHPHIVKAVQEQIAEMDYATAFNMGHPKAFELAEKVIVTDDNPRNEKPQIIRSEILKYCPKAIEIPNRKVAIVEAVKNLEKNSILIIAGKGHEKIQILKHKTIPFDDVKIAKQILQQY